MTCRSSSVAGLSRNGQERQVRMSAGPQQLWEDPSLHASEPSVFVSSLSLSHSLSLSAGVWEVQGDTGVH